MKTCTKCKRELDESCFYRVTKTGKIWSHCKACQREYQRSWIINNRDYLRRFNAANRHKYRDAQKRADEKWRLLNPEKHAAHVAVHRATESGRLTRMPCEVCGKRKSEAHHDDYSRPLDVRWLCRKHHMAHHKATASATK